MLWKVEGGWCICTHSSPPSALRLQTADLRLSCREHNILIITITSPIPAASWQHYLHRCTEEGGGRTSKLWTDSTYPLGTTDGSGAVVNCKIIQYFLRIYHNSGGRGEIWSNVQTWNAEERNCEYECWICTVSRLGLLFTAPITHLLVLLISITTLYTLRSSITQSN